MTLAQIGAVIGVSEDRLKSISAGRARKFHQSEINGLVKDLGVRPEFVASGEGDVLVPYKRAPEVQVAFMDEPNPSSYSPARATMEDFVTVPRYDVQACAGHGVEIHSEQIVDYLAFRSDWVHNALGVNAKDLALISVKGDSMEPTLSNGDLILLDMHSGRVEDNAVYALQHNGTLMVKRIQRRMDGSVVVKSDNPRYDPETLPADAAAQLRVVGRVVWAGRRM